jgi:hypothetical protein
MAKVACHFCEDVYDSLLSLSFVGNVDVIASSTIYHLIPTYFFLIVHQLVYIECIRLSGNVVVMCKNGMLWCRTVSTALYSFQGGGS